MNLLNKMYEGLEGVRVGLTTGSVELDKLIYGITKATFGLVAAQEKVGKSKFTRWHFILQPYLNEVLRNNKKVRWILYTLEEPRFNVEADIVSGLAFELYNMNISRNKILGEELDDNGKPAFLTKHEQEVVKNIYYDHIIPLFGEFDDEGIQLKEGLITTYESGITPSMLENHLLEFAKIHGDIQYKTMKKIMRNVLQDVPVISNFAPHDDTHPIVIIDDLRLLEEEPGVVGEKAIVDTTAKLLVKLTQQLKWYSIIGIIHLNRENTNFERINSIGRHRYYPDSSLIMSTSVVAQRVTYVLTMFNPAAPTFETPMHFGVKVPKDGSHRTIHLVTSRKTAAPKHLACTFGQTNISFTNYQVLH